MPISAMRMSEFARKRSGERRLELRIRKKKIDFPSRLVAIAIEALIARSRGRDRRDEFQFVDPECRRRPSARRSFLQRRAGKGAATHGVRRGP